MRSPDVSDRDCVNVDRREEGEAPAVTGYLHRRFAESFAAFGRPRQLPCSGGWILERDIPGSPYRDAMGCYPLFACRDWSRVGEDLADLEGELVSLALVADPYCGYDISDLERWFDTVVPFKQHFFADFARPVEEFVSRRHRRRAAAALEKLTVARHPNPPDFLDEWVELYSTLVRRHKLTGIKALSAAGFACQLSVPGAIVLRAIYDGGTVGAHIYYTHGDRAYCHLAAFSAVGYELLASFALQWQGILYFADKVRYLGLGAGAGVQASANDGLTQFKRGWASGTRTAYFCGRVFDRSKYAELVATRAMSPAIPFFPAYRAGEFR